MAPAARPARPTRARGPRAPRIALLLGLDLGSTHVKAVLATADGAVLAVARRPTPLRRLGRGRAAHDPDALVGAAEAALAEVAAAAGGRTIAGLGVAGMAEAGLLIDRRGRPLGEVIPWWDPRSEAEAQAIATEVGAARLFAVTGLRPQAKHSLAKLLWLRRHRPAAVGRARAWAGVPELVVHALAGDLATNASLASRTQAFDVGAGRWDEELLDLAGFSAERMPEVVPLGRPAGGLLPGSAARLGLPAGLPVAVAGHDHLVGALGAGIVRPGQALDSMGSAEACLLVTERPVLDDRLRLAGCSVGRHALDGVAYVMAGLQASGALVEWFIQTFLAGASGGRPGDAERYRAFVDLLESRRDGPSGLIVLPYPRGRTAPAPDPAARLAILGLDLETGLPALGLGVLEGTAFAVRWIFEEIARTSGVRIRAVGLIGGGTRNPAWLRVKRAVAPWPLKLAETEEAAALGAALVGGLAGDVFGSVRDALAATAPLRSLAAPPAGTAAAFDRAYRTGFLAAVGAPSPDGPPRPARPAAGRNADERRRAAGPGAPLTPAGPS